MAWAVGGTGILAQKILCIPKNFRQTFSSLRLSCVKILPTSYMKKESLNKEKPCNVVFKYIYLYLFIYNIYI